MFSTPQRIILTPGLKIAITPRPTRKTGWRDIIPTNSFTKYTINLKETVPYSLNIRNSKKKFTFLPPQSINLTTGLPKELGGQISAIASHLQSLEEIQKEMWLVG